MGNKEWWIAETHRTRREEAMERAALIALLGWEKETHTASERYAATTGELVQWAREAGLISNALAKA